jgi:uncharacterized membrane protein YqjE
MAQKAERFEGTGLLDHLQALFGSVADYLRARLQLVGLESKEAFVHYLKIVAFLVGAMLLILFGYLFLGFGIAFAIGRLLHVQWLWVLLGIGLFHVLGAVVLVLLARTKIAVPMFRSTIGEFKKDQECLTVR